MNAHVTEPDSADRAAIELVDLWRNRRRTSIEARHVRSADETIAVPDDAKVVHVSLRRLNRIISVDRSNSALVAEAGVTVDSLRAATADTGLWCPALRWLSGSTLLGAAVAGAHGRRSIRYGAIQDYLLGLRFACPAHGDVRHGTMAIKNASGYSLTGIVAGSRGCLGVVLEATIRLVPLPSHRTVCQFRFDRVDRGWLAAQEVAHPNYGAAAIEVATIQLHETIDVLVEVEDVVEEIATCRMQGIVSTLEQRHGYCLPVGPWPPVNISASQRIIRGGVSPDRFATLARVLEPEQGGKGVASKDVVHAGPDWIIAEATGGAVEIGLTANIASTPWNTGIADAPRGGPGVEHVRRSLKHAFDPDNRLPLPD